MLNLKTIDHGQADWDKALGTNFEAIANESKKYTDTGWITDGIVLLNGAKPNSSFLGDIPSFRIVNLDQFSVLMFYGAVKGIKITAGGVNIDVATMPTQVNNWFGQHQHINANFTANMRGDRFNWTIVNGKLTLKESLYSGDENKELYFSTAFIS